MPLQRVLFVCLGNACRSQMAEGFARTYGNDVMTVHSAGLAPAVAVPVETREIMAEKNIDISSHFPKPILDSPDSCFDLVINMSGYPMRQFPAARTWKVSDPIGCDEQTYRDVRDRIERLVMNLVLELRRKKA